MNTKHIEKYILMFAVVALCFTACKKDDLDGKVSLGVAYEPTSTAKSHIEGFTIVFDADDTIKLNDQICLLTGEKLEVEESDDYWAVFPKTATLNASTMKGTVQIPTTQYYELVDGNQRLNGPMAAHLTASRGTLYFKNLYSVLKVEVSAFDKAVEIHQIKVSTLTSGGALAGEVNFDITAATTADPDCVDLTSYTNTETYVQLNLETPYTMQAYEDKEFYLVSMPFENQSLKVELIGVEDGQPKIFTYTPATTKTLGRSRVGYCPINLQYAVIDPYEDLYGDFSVSPTRKVRIAPGNLQYNLNSETWRFAEHPYDVLEQNGNVGTDYADYLRNGTHGGWMSLFGWGTSGWQDNPCRAAYYPNATTDTKSAYYVLGDRYTFLSGPGAQADWGVHNDIYNPATSQIDPAGTWRTLRYDEWGYLLTDRKELYGKTQWCCDVVNAIINGNTVLGLIIYPDGVRSKPAGVAATTTINGKYGTGSFAEDVVVDDLAAGDYEALMALGCAFLPAAGYRGYPYGSVSSPHVTVRGSGEVFLYWSSSPDVANTGDYVWSGLQTYKDNWGFDGQNTMHRDFGASVRLVQDVPRLENKQAKRRKH